MKNLIPWHWRKSEVPVIRESSLADVRTGSVERLFDDMFRSFDDFFRGVSPFGNALMEPGGPRVDLYETDDALRVEAELPGVEEKDVEVSLANGVLTIQGEKRTEREEKKGRVHATERSFGSFQRVLALPCDVDEAGVKATFEKGVLEVHLPKSTPARTRAIPVHGE